MSEQTTTTQNERALAALAHGSILLGLFSNGIGGIVTALVIWVVQRQKSAYVAHQALQALVYQVATFLLTMLAWAAARAMLPASQAATNSRKVVRSRSRMGRWRR